MNNCSVQSYKVNVFSAKSSAVEFIAQFVLTFYWILRFSRDVARSKIIMIMVIIIAEREARAWAEPHN